MRIDSSGNVGVGTTSPGQKLHLKGTDSSDAGDVTLRVDAGTVSSNGAVNNAVLDLTARGKESGGTARTQNCEIRSVGQASPGGVLSFHTDDTSNALQERLRIDSSGRVGIGTSSPTNVKLDIKELSPTQRELVILAFLEVPLPYGFGDCQIPPQIYTLIAIPAAGLQPLL